jgi:hypothetical protein
MNKVTVIKVIAKLYFAGALIGSFLHLIHAAQKGGLTGAEAYSVPFMIDGLALTALVMRGSEFSTRTRRIGFRVFLFTGSMSLAGNVFAAHNIGGAVYGVAIVALFLGMEWLSDHIESAQAEADKLAATEAEAKKAASIAKAQATRQANKALAAKVVKNAEKVTRTAARTH